MIVDSKIKQRAAGIIAAAAASNSDRTAIAAVMMDSAIGSALHHLYVEAGLPPPDHMEREEVAAMVQAAHNFTRMAAVDAHRSFFNQCALLVALLAEMGLDPDFAMAMPCTSDQLAEALNRLRAATLEREEVSE